MIEKKSSFSILVGILLLFGLYLTSLKSYLLFHSLAEIFSIVVACGIFMIAWNSRRFLDNNYLLFIGIAYLFIAALDFIHLLAYKGMGVFTSDEANLSTQLWIAARYLESLSLLIASFFIGRRLRVNVVLLGYTLVFILLIWSIFSEIFPVCFVEGVGLTLFKKISEYVISLILYGSIAMLFKKRHDFDKGILRLLITSIIVTIVSELAFTFYVSVYGLSNLLGHYFKIISFYLIYKAIIETGLKRPYSLLFRDLKQREEELQEAKGDLEIRVKERTKELHENMERLVESEEKLHMLTQKLLTTQEEERRRLARELHDDLTQQLAVLAIDIGKLEVESGSTSDSIRDKLQKVKEKLIKLSADIHAISRQLHPSILDDLGLVEAVESECNSFTKREGIAVNYKSNGIPKNLPKDIAICIYRILQASLSNISRHAQADKVDVSLIGENNSISLTVRDYGIGFDTNNIKKGKGLGLSSMKERVHLIQGDLSIQSRLGEGTMIKVRAPLSRRSVL